MGAVKYKIRRIREVGITNCIKGVSRKSYLYYIHKRFNTPIWHVNPIHFRAYAYEVIDCVKKCNISDYGTIVELGCGVGELLASYPKEIRRIGYDIDENVVRAASYLHKELEIHEGSFDDIHEGMIDCMVMVNCVFDIPTDVLRHDVKELLENNTIKAFIVDTYENNSESEYISHNWNDIIGSRYMKVYRSCGYKANHGALRFIEVWKEKE